MKTKLFYAAVIATALTTGVVRGDDNKSTDKTLGEKTAETLEKAKDKTVEAGHAIVDETKKAATSVKDAVTSDSDARQVQVTLVRGQIEMAREIQAGKTAFVVRNDGGERQNFKIEGQGLDKEFMIGVAPNDTKTLTVDLKPGEYKIHTPLSGKEAGKGGEMSLKVK